MGLAEAMVSYQSWRKPAELRESFEILHEHGLLDRELVEKLVAMTGFRNALAHDYKHFDYGIMYDVLQNRLDDIADFAEAMKKLI